MQNKSWLDLIVDYKWKYGEFTNYNQTGANVLKAENSLINILESKVGLMNLSDFYLAYSNSANCSVSNACITSWMFIKNNDANPPRQWAEWTMNRYDKTNPYCIASSAQSYYTSPDELSARPVMYLSEEINIGGKGTAEEPFTIIGSKPIVNDVKVTSDTGSSITVEVDAIDDKRVTEYCYKLNTESNYTCTSSNTKVYSGLDSKKIYSLEVYVKDGDGNSSEVYEKALRNLKDYLKDKDKKSTLQSTPVDGMYRYKGTATQVDNNYICFGTTDKTKCTTTPDNYMYRIIGLTSEADTTLGLNANQLKIIKATPSSTSQVWHNNSNGDIKWDVSDMKTYLNTTFLNDAVSSKWENGTTWQGLITSQQWYNAYYTNKLSTEPKNATTTYSYQIGLMYATDFVNAYQESRDNWLFMANGWTSNTAVTEWTMSSAGVAGQVRDAWEVSVSGSLLPMMMYWTYAVRPVFYVSPYISLTGEGTTTNPFIINS